LREELMTSNNNQHFAEMPTGKILVIVEGKPIQYSSRILTSHPGIFSNMPAKDTFCHLCWSEMQEVHLEPGGSSAPLQDLAGFLSIVCVR
jgi:hypothetical protein